MKITTDSVLLGAWTCCSEAKEILEVGAGTGVISLMLAQRCPESFVSAMEPHRPTAEELDFNFGQSPWKERLYSFEAGFQQFLDQDIEEYLPKYDLVVSNPPYYRNDQLPDDPWKASARHGVDLTWEILLEGACKILTPAGRVSLIIPARYRSEVLSLAAGLKLYCNRMLEVKPRADKPFFRVLMELGREKKPLQRETLIIHERQGYTEEYRALTREYYPDF